MITSVQIPTPPDLDRDPELAVLAALHAALKAAVFALISAHPPLRDPDCQLGDDTPDSYWVASVFVTIADKLGDTIDAYHRVLDRQHNAASDDDFPL